MNHKQQLEVRRRAQPPLWTPKGIGNVKQLGGFIPVVDSW